MGKAATELRAELDIDVTIDQDTQDVPGSPSIPDTILKKIAASEAVVADLTLTHTSDKQVDPEKRGSNPNVMLEYGYALRVGDRNIIGVINTAFGAVEELSFDLRHKRCITYCAAMGGGENERTQARMIWPRNSRERSARSSRPRQDPTPQKELLAAERGCDQLRRLVRHRRFLNNLRLARTSPPATQS